MASASPWHALAATSGIPTPSHEFPLTLPGARDSPKLGQPFERLNLGPSVPTSSHPFVFGEDSTTFNPSPPRASRDQSHVASTSPEAQFNAANLSIPSGAISGPLSRPDSPLRSASLAQRRSSAPMLSLGGNLPTGGGAPALNTGSTSRIKPVDGTELRTLAASDSTLILDLRPPSSFEASHIVGAHSLSVPSTLLRRPAFGLPKLIQLLSPPSRQVVNRWREMANIVLVDHDTETVPEGSILHSITNKFDREGYTGRISFLRGGFVSVANDESFELESSTPTEESKEAATATPYLGRLSRLAFQVGSTNTFNGGRAGTVPQTAAVVRENPFKSMTIPPMTGRIAPSTDMSRSQIQPANPFFDNIRQNIELSHGGITERIPLALPQSIIDRAGELPPFLRDLVKMPSDQSMERLARQFQRLERKEQKRLQSVMNVLSKGNTTPQGNHIITGEDAEDMDKLAGGTIRTRSGYYPFSITAGVERGAKNRYKNIWPYDFSRVRLGSPADDDSDYINASFVQPRGTTRRYIATQGPLDATYRDFWTVVWEQNVHVIVMLTKQFEGGLMKCGKYWNEQVYGDLRLKLVSQTGGEDKAEGATTGFDFGMAAQTPETKAEQPSGNIKRVFHLSHVSAPDKIRTVAQIQCVSWPDFDVPESPQVLLQLMRDVDAAVEETCGCGEDRCQIPPVLVHCSAGIGRTGSYILADAIADGLRRERRMAAVAAEAEEAAKGPQPAPRQQITSKPRAASPEDMDLDSPIDRDQSSTASSTPTTTRSGDVLSVTQSCDPHRLPTPIGLMADPIVDVLSAMRVQRMSLVQSLRQYMFVHRAIIAHYLATIDDERSGKKRETEQQSTGATLVSQGSTATQVSTSSGDTSISSVSTGASKVSATSVATTASQGSKSTTDDEAHFKRKPSSTDLQPEADIRLRTAAGDLSLNDEGSKLSKRTSFKKRRG